MGERTGKKVGVMVVGGAGGIGRSAHIPAILASDAVQLVGVVDIDVAALADVQSNVGCWVSTDFNEAVARDGVDIVDICSPDFAHAEQTIAAARAGRHVLCEKPMALSITDALAVREAVRNAGVKFMVAQSMRFHPRWRAVKRAIDDGEIGRPVFVRVWGRGRPFSYPANSFYRKPQSVGPIIHNGMHYFDLSAWLAGSLPRWVFATALSHYPVDDELPGANYWSVQLGFESGVLGHVEYNFAALEMPPERTDLGAMVVGTHGSVASMPEGGRLVELVGPTGFSWPSSHPAPGWHDAFRAEIEHFARCVIEDREPEISIDWSIRVLATCLACVKSAREAMPVEVAALLEGCQ